MMVAGEGRQRAKRFTEASLPRGRPPHPGPAWGNEYERILARRSEEVKRFLADAHAVLNASPAAVSTPRRLRATIAAMAYGFRYLLVTPDGEPHNPAALVTAVPNWEEGEILALGGGEQLRIVHINLELDAPRTGPCCAETLAGEGGTRWSPGATAQCP
jgi:hypothetical protein